MKRVLAFLPAALPVLAIAVLIVRGEVVVHTGRQWVVRARGYDPRDLVRGHYLTYRLDWKTEPNASCPSADCCYCLEEDTKKGGEAAVAEPRVLLRSCEDTARCESHFSVTELPNLERFYIPETDSQALDHALRDRERNVMVQISVTGSGHVGIQDLVIDGRPFRDWLKADAGHP